MIWGPGPNLNIKTVFPSYWDSHLIFNMGIPKRVRRHIYVEMAPVVSYAHPTETSTGCLRLTCPSQTWNSFLWCDKGPMMSQLTDLIKWPIYLLHLITIYLHVDSSDKESMTPRWCRSTPFQLCLIYLYINVNGILLECMHYFAM